MTARKYNVVIAYNFMNVDRNRPKYFMENIGGWFSPQIIRASFCKSLVHISTYLCINNQFKDGANISAKKLTNIIVARYFTVCYMWNDNISCKFIRVWVLIVPCHISLCRSLDPKCLLESFLHSTFDSLIDGTANVILATLKMSFSIM